MPIILKDELRESSTIMEHSQSLFQITQNRKINYHYKYPLISYDRVTESASSI